MDNIASHRKAVILSLCPKCRSDFFRVSTHVIRRVDPLQVIKERCDVCQKARGYDYTIQEKLREDKV